MFSAGTIVSNPWREAIEATMFTESLSLRKFPILGGRLLKPKQENHE